MFRFMCALTSEMATAAVEDARGERGGAVGRLEHVEKCFGTPPEEAINGMTPRPTPSHELVVEPVPWPSS